MNAEMSQRMEQIMKTAPVIPVLVVEDAGQAVPLARALVAGGLRVLEITLRTAAALDAIRAIAKEVPDGIVGVGTVRTGADLKAAEDAGATFAVSPGLTPALAQAAGDSKIPLLPGVMTASEVMAAADVGFRHLKLFPAQVAGGAGALKALSGPFPEARFCPTGGVSKSNMAEFLALPNVLCVGGSWVAPRDAVQGGDWSRIETLAREAVAAAG